VKQSQEIATSSRQGGTPRNDYFSWPFTIIGFFIFYTIFLVKEKQPFFKETVEKFF